MVGVILLAMAGIWAIFTGGAFLTLALRENMRRGYALLRVGLGVACIAAALKLAWGHGSF